MNQNINRYYPIGYTGWKYLRVNGNRYLHSQLWNMNRIRIIECDIEEKWMILKEKSENDEEWIEINMKEIKKKDIIDLNENGERWEGSSLEGVPFGYGCIYNEDNNIIYQGFIYERMKVCFGKEFYGDNGLIEYEGDYYNNMRYGNGKLYNKKGELIYEGEWSLNKPIGDMKMRIENELNEDDIHYGIEELVIGKNCMGNVKCFKLIGFNYLTKLVIEENDLEKMILFCIEECNELVDVRLEGAKYSRKNNNHSDSMFCIKNCSNLLSIEIGTNWFITCKKVELDSMI